MVSKKALCAISECSKPARARGWCHNHYNRWLKYKDPIGIPETRRVRLAFIENAARSTSDACICWPFAGNHGRGVIWIKGQNRYVQRIVCEMVHGRPPSPEYDSAHSCGKGHLGCVNGRHLSWKTPKENQADAVIHGTAPRGERSGMAKLTSEKVRQIRALNGKMSKREIAEKFGVGRSNIKKIQANQIWKWLQ
jgi:hypothetical protein